MPLRIALFTFAAILLASGSAVRAGGKGKNNDAADLAKARQRINALEAENKARERQIDDLQGALKKLKGDDKSDDNRIQKLQQELNEREKTIQQLRNSLGKEKTDDKKDDQQISALRKELDQLRDRVKELEATEKGKHVHVAFYRLKEGGNPNLANELVDDAQRKLGKIPSVRNIWVGTPSSRGAPASKTDYHVGLIAVFDNADAMKRFLDHPAYKQHNQGLRKNFEPTVYDVSRD